ncbi:excalibur calcium-binding domain-containing protein [Sulfuricurvum sp.]|uniref:excalibur calcium-binding domain-containing protein n=1 Tax=Sulfuricurvum sp. TaxID=2025608 RepID=UPI002D4999C7|nr:excalibur calcium-binding domain-containing protein [Sulfuricurvum sp.]HZF70347.1 excalibur calcium-binding domain-containing protein [Sulfuricurvum sp.]
MKQTIIFFLLLSTVILAADRKKCFDDYKAGLLTKEEMMKCSSIEDTSYPQIIDDAVEHRAHDQHKNYEPIQTKSIKSEPKQQFRCDGRKHCSQMKSYLEAKFFLDNCPDTMMDGDDDGIPCEQQFGMH